MRKYKMLLSDGKTVIDVAHIGCNHNAYGSSYGGIMSSYPNAFDNDDLVNMEAGFNYRECSIGNIKEAYEILKSLLMEKKPTTLEEYCLCVQETVLRYFGDYSNISERLSYFPDNDEVDFDHKKRGQVSDLAHKNAAMCVERAMLAQNLLKTLNIDATYKTAGVVINGKRDAHAFNLLQYDGKYYLFDATIPTMRNDEITPLITELPKEVYDKIKMPNSDIGISVHVTHYNPLQKKDYDIIYDAKRKETYEVDEQFTK